MTENDQISGRNMNFWYQSRVSPKPRYISEKDVNAKSDSATAHKIGQLFQFLYFFGSFLSINVIYVNKFINLHVFKQFQFYSLINLMR